MDRQERSSVQQVDKDTAPDECCVDGDVIVHETHVDEGVGSGRCDRENEKLTLSLMATT